MDEKEAREKAIEAMRTYSVGMVESLRIPLSQYFGKQLDLPEVQAWAINYAESKGYTLPLCEFCHQPKRPSEDHRHWARPG